MMGNMYLKLNSNYVEHSSVKYFSNYIWILILLKPKSISYRNM